MLTALRFRDRGAGPAAAARGRRRAAGAADAGPDRPAGGCQPSHSAQDRDRRCSIAGLVAALQWLVGSSPSARAYGAFRIEPTTCRCPATAPRRCTGPPRKRWPTCPSMRMRSSHRSTVRLGEGGFARGEATTASDSIRSCCGPAPGFGLRALLRAGRAARGWPRSARTPNGGASLMLSIPVHGDAPASADGGRSEGCVKWEHCGAGHALRVIVIDDHAIVRRGIVEILDRAHPS